VTLLRRTAELAEAHVGGLGERRVGASASYEDVLAALDAPLPENGCPPEQAVDQLVAAADPGLIASPGPRYFGFVTGGALPAALAADWLVSAWDQNAFSRVASPAAAAIEAAAERWVLEALGLPETAVVGFPTGATGGNFVGLAAARNRVLARAGWDVAADGLFGAPPVRVLVGEEVHASLLNALRLVGLGEARAERIPADGNGAMRADALAAALDDSPTIVCAQAGNVNTGASDPLAEIVAAARARDAWVHVDGAFGLWAAASPRHRAQVRGAEGADSWSVDAHKWLNVPYDCGMAIVADPAAARAALASEAAYLPSGGGRDASDYVAESSRRARSIPVWAALRSLGRAGVADLVDRCCALAMRAAEALSARDGVEVLNDVVLNQALVRFDDDDATTRRVIEDVQRGGEAWLGGTVWRGRAAARISVSGWNTTEADIDRLVNALAAAHRGAAAPAA
jgi:glutamate/tyrosine decarboxylase-like PLP-dependent enzyme